MRVLGGIRAFGGLIETFGSAALVGGGAATSEVGVGIPAVAVGILGVGNGLDNFQAGLRQLFSGVPEPTVQHQAYMAMGASDGTANLIEFGTNAALGVGTLKVMSMGPEAALSTSPAFLDSTFAAETATASAPGARMVVGGVPATEIAGRLSPAQMAALQAEHGTEFAQVYLTGAGRNGGGGTYYLIQGTEGGVQIPIGSNVRWINHTHPEILNGNTVPLTASGADRNVLSLLQRSGSPQVRSQVVPQVGDPFYFKR